MNSALSLEQRRMLCNVAIQAAKEAGQWVEQFNAHKLQRVFKDTGSSEASQLVTEVDIRSEEIIRQRLHKESEALNIAFVGEESSFSISENAHERFEKPYFWCVDPLDGTLPYVEGRAGYAVSIALVAQTGKPLIGVVYDPSCRTVYHAIKGQGIYRNSTPLHKAKGVPTSLTVYADTSFKIHERYESALVALNECAKALGLGDVTFVYGNGAVKNACHVLESNHACYLKLPKKQEGGGSIWDYAATACIADEIGGWASNIHGQPLAFNPQGSTFMNRDGIIFASNGHIASCLIDALFLEK